MSQTTPGAPPGAPAPDVRAHKTAAAPPRTRLARGEKAMIWGSVALVATIGGGTWWASRMNDMPDIVIPRAVMPSPNAFDEYVAATGKIVRTSDVDDASEQISGRWKPRTPPRAASAGSGRITAASAIKPFTPAELDALVWANAPALNGVRAAFKHEYRHPRVTDFNYLMPYLADFRKMTRLFRVEAHTRANRGDFAGATNSGLDAMQLGVETPRGGVLICALVGYACEAIGRRTVAQYRDRLTGPECRRAALRLEAMDNARTPIADTLREEKYTTLGSLKTLFATKTTAQIATEFGASYGSASSSGGGGPFDVAAILEKLRFQGRMANVSKRQVIVNLDKFANAQIARAEREPWTPNAKPIPLPDDPISQLLLPVLEGATFKDDQTRAESRLLMTTLAVQAYKHEKGAFPATLEELTRTGYLKRVPEDPFAPAFHTPLRYRVVGGKAMRSYDFIVYSVGPDGKDDNGKSIPAKIGQFNQSVGATDQGDLTVPPLVKPPAR